MKLSLCGLRSAPVVANQVPLALSNARARRGCKKVSKKIAEVVKFTVIRKYFQQFITNADRQGASRELITFRSGRLSAFLSVPCYAVERINN